MAKFWRSIRAVLHNTPIPIAGGMTINQGKDILNTLKSTPATQTAYRDVLAQVPDEDLAAYEEKRKKDMLYASLIVGSMIIAGGTIMVMAGKK